MGRGKLAMQLITKEKARAATFQKRKRSLFKKAYELSILCAIDVCVIINTDLLKAKSETWPENLDEVGRIIANYEAQGVNGQANKKEKSAVKMAARAKFPDWDNRINCFSGKQLFELLNIIDRKIMVVDQRLNTLLTLHTDQFSRLPEQLINLTSSFQSDYGNFGFDWVNEYPETQRNLGILDNEMLHLQMQPEMEFQSELIAYPTPVTPLQTWPPPPLLPHPSIPRMPFLPPCPTPWQMMDEEYKERLSTMNGFCNFRGI